MWYWQYVQQVILKFSCPKNTFQDIYKWHRMYILKHEIYQINEDVGNKHRYCGLCLQEQKCIHRLKLCYKYRSCIFIFGWMLYFILNTYLYFTYPSIFSFFWGGGIFCIFNNNNILYTTIRLQYNIVSIQKCKPN